VVWSSSWWNKRGHVRSGHHSRAPIDCARSCLSHRQEWVPQLGASWLPILPEGSTCPSGEVEYAEVVGRFDDVMGAQARWKLSPEAPISPETFSQGSGWMEVDFRASSD
jgi:hypothetical protein